MGKIFVLSTLRVLVCLCLLAFPMKQAAAFFVQPEAVPYTYDGHTYHHAAAINISGSMTIIWYCESDYVDAAYDPSNGTFSYFCGGANSDYSNLAVHAATGLARLCFNADCSSKADYYQTSSFMGGYNSVSTPLEDNLYSGINVINTVTYDVAMNANLSPSRTGLFTFPFSGDTAYTANVSAVMDQTTLGTGAVYASGENNAVQTFEGETGTVGPYSFDKTCYRKSDNTPFGISFNYVGTSGSGGAYYLCYDAHPGYDYPKSYHTAIYAPASGILCVFTSQTSQSSPSDVWRDITKCPFASAPQQSGITWSNYHTFYILHGPLVLNGGSYTFMTVFLHSDDLVSGIRTAVESNGYANVETLQQIAEVGNYPGTFGHHMHIEVYKYNGSTWDRVDPYGDGTNNILWAP